MKRNKRIIRSLRILPLQSLLAAECHSDLLTFPPHSGEVVDANQGGTPIGLMVLAQNRFEQRAWENFDEKIRSHRFPNPASLANPARDHPNNALAALTCFGVIQCPVIEP
jgi:hypothetical protein